MPLESITATSGVCSEDSCLFLLPTTCSTLKMRKVRENRKLDDGRVRLIVSSLLAFLLILVIYFSPGSYYELYEVINNYLTNLSTCTQGVVAPISNETFILRQLLMLLQKLFPHYEINSIGYLFFIYLGITSVYFCLFSLVKDKIPLVGVLAVSTILFAEHIISINTTRISFILGLGSILMLLLPNFRQSKIHLCIYLFLSILCIFCRVEIGAIVSFIGVILVLTNKSLKLPVYPVLFSFSFSLIHHVIRCGEPDV